MSTTFDQDHELIKGMSYGSGMLTREVLQKAYNALSADKSLQEEFIWALSQLTSRLGTLRSKIESQREDIERLRNELEAWEHPGKIKLPHRSA